MAIKKPSEMNFSGKNIIMLISGLPGVGKTTLALSAPDVLLIDADEGLSRVNPAHRKDASMCATYEELLADVKAAEGQYKTIVIDTCGALIDLIKDWAVRTEPKARKTSGGISLQGFGFVKNEFLRLSAELRKKFNVIFLFHEQMTRNGEDTFFDIVCEGNAKVSVWQPADIGGHLHIMNGERYLGFTPTANYNAKSAYGIKGLIKVPELAEGQPNDFLSKLFDKVRENLAAETAALKPQEEAYKAAMEAGMALISAIKTPEDVTECVAQLAKLDHALTSKAELSNALKVVLKDNGIVYDKKTKQYKAADAE